jgi:serine/threonine-protein kinase
VKNSPHNTNTTLPTEIRFLREKKYTVIRDLGFGACGTTILIRDEQLNTNFVCKKFSPLFSDQDQPDFHELFDRFREEARILFRLSHPNVVRVYNFYDYVEHRTAYIIMEYVNGYSIIEYLSSNPENASIVFSNLIDGFNHLEDVGVLHRDIRPENILIAEQGTPKIIDFGFGKIISDPYGTFSKSISLNWWCEVPDDFSEGTYDHCTEVYFVGKIFESVINNFDLETFEYRSIVESMCARNPQNRIKNFREIGAMIARSQFSEVRFSQNNLQAYRNFAQYLSAIFASISSESSYNRDVDIIITALDSLYKRTMLEEHIPDPVVLARIFVRGAFRYRKNVEVPISVLKSFHDLLKTATPEHKSIILGNIFSRLDATERTSPPSIDDEIPF